MKISLLNKVGFLPHPILMIGQEIHQDHIDGSTDFLISVYCSRFAAHYLTCLPICLNAKLNGLGIDTLDINDLTSILMDYELCIAVSSTLQKVSGMDEGRGKNLPQGERTIPFDITMQSFTGG